MANFNKTFTIGRLTKDPDLRYTPSGMPVCEFCLAVDEGTKEKPVAEFIPVTIYGKGAESLHKYAGKGSTLHVEGRLHLDQWEDRQTGDRRQKLIVIARTFQFLDKRENSNPEYAQPEPQYQHGRYTREDVPPPPPPMEDDSVSGIVDDIPF